MTHNRNRSWVGLGESKPYAYLREAMVSGLMDGICSLSTDDQAPAVVVVEVLAHRQSAIVEAIGSWEFSAHDFTDDELLYGARLMLEHALQMPELEQWRMPTDNLTKFLAACRSAYNSFVPYHNFWHVIDVLQSVFYFLVQLGTLPPYPPGNPLREPSKSNPKPPIPALLIPFDALTLLITAIGHDVGHPGVNNTFLIILNAPLAQLYNDRSVLESFHCAAYSQILRRHWPSVFSSKDMRQLMISCILATDMGLHFDYMKKLGWLQEKLHEDGGAEGWNGRVIQENRTLACNLLIKCADISNVARTFDCAASWTMILTDEFSRQATIETDLELPTALFAPPVRETVALGQSQIGFINIFAYPLFQGVGDIMPAMGFCLEEIIKNKAIWEEKVSAEQARVRAVGGGRKDSDDSVAQDARFSPRHLSLATSTTDITAESSESELQPESESIGNSGSSRSRSTTKPAQPSGLRNNSMLESIQQSQADAVVGQRERRDKDATTGMLDSQSNLSGSRVESRFVPVDERGFSGSQPAASANRQQDGGKGKGRGSEREAPQRDTTEIGTNRPMTSERRSEATDWSTSVPSSNRASQATSYAGKTEGTGTAKLSPSTRGTSANSSEDKSGLAVPAPQGQQQFKSASTPDLRADIASGDGRPEGAGAVSAEVPREGLVATMRSLARKPSSNRFKFWKKKSAEGGPSGGPRPKSRDDMPRG